MKVPVNITPTPTPKEYYRTREIFCSQKHLKYEARLEFPREVGGIVSTK